MTDGGNPALGAIPRTKLYRPPVPADVVPRTNLFERMRSSKDLPLTLVCAPAGYGKSTLVSHWIDMSGVRSAWLSLDESENDLSTFLSCLVAAVQTLFPSACRDTIDQLSTTHDNPSPSFLAALLINGLDRVESEFVLVLDDFHRVDDLEIQDLLSRLLERPHRRLRLVILSRRQPALPLARLRASHSMVEIRLKELQFSQVETEAFLNKSIDIPLGPDSLKRAHERLEGWPVALRLLSLTLQDREDVNEFIRSISAKTGPIQDYLVSETLSHLPRPIRNCLSRTSILDRFCAPLCRHVCDNKCDCLDCSFLGQDTSQGLPGSSPLVIPLDDGHEWFRYHHLFQDLLQSQLKERLKPEDISLLHKRAAAWMEENGHFEEAIQHLLKAGDATEVGRLVVRNRYSILNQEQWHRLENWIHALPEELLNDDPELLLIKAWHLENRVRFSEAFETLDRVEEMMEDKTYGPDERRRLRGEISALRSLQFYLESNGPAAVETARESLDLLPSDCLSARGYATLVLVASEQMVGDLARARKVGFEALDSLSHSSSTLHGRLFASLCFVNWIGNDLPSLKTAAKRCLEIGESEGLLELSICGRYFLGIAHYARNELSEAESILSPVASQNVIPNLEFPSESSFALASIYQATGQGERAAEILETASDRALTFRNKTIFNRMQAFKAEFALRQGRVSEAQEWARGFEGEPLTPPYLFHFPHLTLARTLMRSKEKENWKRALDLLEEIETYLTRIHNTCFLIEALVLQTLLFDHMGESSIAIQKLAEAVKLAQPGGAVRVFADNPEIVPLLPNLDLNPEQAEFLSQIRNALPEEAKGEVAGLPDGEPLSEFVTDALTNREMDILELLAQRLSNKEIAEELFISPATVKRHSENIYRKLDVKSRREAVTKARGMNILKPQHGP